jgi:predicted TIM-barrel fold metal-dependent hydrolase
MRWKCVKQSEMRASRRSPLGGAGETACFTFHLSVGETYSANVSSTVGLREGLFQPSGKSGGRTLDEAKPPRIDTHLHIWRQDQAVTADAWTRPAGDALVEDCLAQLDQNGISFAVIGAASFHGEENDYVRAALGQHSRLRATAILPMDADWRQMRRMRDEGFVGIRLMWSRHDNAPCALADLAPLLRRVADLGWHVHLLDRPERMAASIAAVEASGARLVIDHFGLVRDRQGTGHAGFKAMLDAVARGTTWIRVSGGFRLGPLDIAMEHADAVRRVAGPDRLLWGSDWPFVGYENLMTYEKSLSLYRLLFPDDEFRREMDEGAMSFYLN